MIEIPPPDRELVDELLPFLALSEKQRERLKQSLRDRWFSGFWWGAVLATPFAIWGGYLLALLVGVGK